MEDTEEVIETRLVFDDPSYDLLKDIKETGKVLIRLWAVGTPHRHKGWIAYWLDKNLYQQLIATLPPECILSENSGVGCPPGFNDGIIVTYVGGDCIYVRGHTPTDLTTWTVFHVKPEDSPV